LQDRHQVTDAKLPFQEKGENSQTGLIGKGFEKARRILHGIIVSAYADVVNIFFKMIKTEQKRELFLMDLMGLPGVLQLLNE
jgi:hypothetical protein